MPLDRLFESNWSQEVTDEDQGRSPRVKGWEVERVVALRIPRKPAWTCGPAHRGVVGHTMEFRSYHTYSEKPVKGEGKEELWLYSNRFLAVTDLEVGIF